jgi:hypothetical protein
MLDVIRFRLWPTFTFRSDIQIEGLQWNCVLSTMQQKR